jgi:hypothetical protein
MSIKREIKKYSQLLNLAQATVGSLAVAVVTFKPDLMAAVSPTTGAVILVGLATLNGVLTKIKQDL